MAVETFYLGILRSIAFKYHTPAYIQELSLSLSENSGTMEFLDKKQTEIHTGPLAIGPKGRLDIEIDAIHNAGFHVPVGTHVTFFPCFCIFKTCYTLAYNMHGYWDVIHSLDV